jgi:hypothetical protein
MAFATEDVKHNWKENILNQRGSELSIAAWCRQNGIPPHVFYYWQSKLFPKAPKSRSDFAEVEADKEDSKPSIILEYQGFRVYLHQHFDTVVLKRCLEVLKTC